jgi:hypothetical protein
VGFATMTNDVKDDATRNEMYHRECLLLIITVRFD